MIKNTTQLLKSFFLLSFLLVPHLISAQQYISLWPKGKMPNSKGMILEHIEERERITQLPSPGMYVFTPSKEENKGTAVLICPPGGYWKLVYNIGGFQIAKWFNTMGVNAFVLMYRLPTSPDLIDRQYGPIQDAQRAMKIIRANAKEWGIDPDKVGVYGSSAGGHLATTLATTREDHSNIGDSFDNHGFLPDFQILVSPVISLTSHYHKGSRDALLGENAPESLAKQFSNERNVKDFTPPAFMVHANNDGSVSPLNSLMYYEALKEKGINASLHIFPAGGHGIALRNNPGSTQLWPLIGEAWLKEMGFLEFEEVGEE